MEHIPTYLTVSGLTQSKQERNLRFYQKLSEVIKEYRNAGQRRCWSWGTIASRFPNAHRALVKRFGSSYRKIDVLRFLFPSPRCKVCGESYQITGGLKPWCSNRCMGKDPDIQGLKSRTNLKNFGVDNPFKSEKVMKAVREERLARTGYKHARQDPTINRRAKRRQLKTVRERYGVDNVMFIPGMQALIVTRNQEKYGEDYPMQTPEVFYRAMEASHRIKLDRYKGRDYKVQSTYESRIFQQLVDKFGIENVHTQFHSDFPDYIMREAGTWPDLYVSSIDTFVEVKSTWTLWGTDGMLKSNRKKALASNKSGNVIRWVLMVPGKGKVILPKDWYNMTTTELKDYAMSNLR